MNYVGFVEAIKPNRYEIKDKCGDAMNVKFYIPEEELDLDNKVKNIIDKINLLHTKTPVDMIDIEIIKTKLSRELKKRIVRVYELLKEFFESFFHHRTYDVIIRDELTFEKSVEHILLWYQDLIVIFCELKECEDSPHTLNSIIALINNIVNGNIYIRAEHFKVLIFQLLQEYVAKLIVKINH